MATVEDQDRYFQGKIEGSIPKNLVGEGTIQRLLNGRFVEGAISNAIGFDELDLTFKPHKRSNDDGEGPYASPVTHDDIIHRGDVQLVAPLRNVAGNFIILVISGVMYQVDLADNSVIEITPTDAFLPENSSIYPLSYADNDGGTTAAGGYLVVFNYPNKSIFVNHQESRLAVTEDPSWEMPPARMGASAGNRMFTISGDNFMFASDPLGGASPLAPLTFQETLDSNASFYQQVFSIGSVLDVEHVTAVCRIPQYLSANQDFLAQQLLVSTKNKKFIIAAAAPRTNWENVQFISYAGSTDGIAGPLACTNIGNVLLYITTAGRIKTLGQDRERETQLSETFLDDGLGQYLCPCESTYHVRDWYRTLDHSRSIVKFNNNRLYATVYPQSAPAIGSYGEKLTSPTHRALAVASLDSRTQLGPRASFAWEGFYDWLNPIGLITIGQDMYVVSKDEYGRIRYYKENFNKVDEHTTVIYTRGYTANAVGSSRGLYTGSLYFRKLSGPVKITISYLVDDKWVCGSECTNCSKLYRFSFLNRWRTDGSSIPLRIEIEHNGCRFELESIRVSGEVSKQDKNNG